MTPRGRQAGFGIIELMVGIAIGLAVLAVAGQLFAQASLSGRMHNSLSRMQTNGRYALDMMGRVVRQAGYRSSPLINFPTATPALAGVNGTTDSITVRYYAQTGGESDCLGNNFAAGALMTYTFYVSGTSLRCGTTLADGQPIVEGVENFQVLYGVDNDNDQSVDSYTTAASATMAQVIAVRVRLLVRSETDRVAAGAQTYVVTNDSGALSSVTATDLRLRQQFGATFTLRNRITRCLSGCTS